MKTFELKPTDENIRQTFFVDKISRNEDVFNCVKILNSLSEASSIALNGGWGSGKTFFVKQVKMVLDALNPHVQSDNEAAKIKDRFLANKEHEKIEIIPQVCVYYDAWQYDNEDEPLLSLVYTILQNVKSNFSFDEKESFWATAASIANLATGRDWKGVIDALKKKSPLDPIAETRNLAQKVDDFLQSLLVERGDRLVILVDELDRCSPSFAVKLLEQIKHHFSNENITFVFSVNIDELQHTIKQFYGNEFSACRYLDKFFNYRISLPKTALSKYYKSLGCEIGDDMQAIIRDAVIKAYRLELREIARYLQCLQMVNENKTFDGTIRGFMSADYSGVNFCQAWFLPIMFGLRMTDSEKYDDFVNGRDFSPLIDLIKHLSPDALETGRLYCSPFKKDGSEDLVEKLEDILCIVYEDVFNKVRENRSICIKHGHFAFSRKTLEILMKESTLLLKYPISKEH